MANFSINGQPIKNPTEYSVEYYTLTKSTRVANGDMVMDYVANKRKFQFSYAAIKAADLNEILFQLWTNLETTRQCFHTLEYNDNGTMRTVTVYAGAIPKKLQRAFSSALGSDWVWKDVSFSLIER